MSEELSIISQNLNKKGLSHEKVKRYTEEKKADIYAFQELAQTFEADTYVFQESKWTSKGKSKKVTYNITDIIVDGESKGTTCPEEEIWKRAFPWSEFKSGYFKEFEITFQGKAILLINFHSSLRYYIPLRYTLLERLKEIKSETEFVILLGDFNAAFALQTDQPIKENDDFLQEIEKLGFKECLSDLEKKNRKPQYTYTHTPKKKDKKAEHKDAEYKKLDHIFISQGLSDLSHQGWTFSIQYINDVNTSFSPSESEQAFTDHSGIKLTIQVKQ